MITDPNFARELAGDLLEINAVMLRPREPFVWSSGWNAPIYCDNRLTMLYPDIRRKIARKFAGIIQSDFPETEVVTGTAISGIPHSAWVADLLDKPMAYVRGKTKVYGLGNQIEGGVKKGQPTILIEDLVSTGTSVLSVADTLRFVGADVRGILSIFTYGFKISEESFTRHDLPFRALTDYPTLLEVALERKVISPADLDYLNEWRQSPDTWPAKPV